MKTLILGLPVAEIVHLLRAEIETAHGAPELETAAEKEYLIEEDFDRSGYGIHDGMEFDLVTSIATLTIEPRVEKGYWILEATVERELGPIPNSEEDALMRSELTLEQFEAELGAPGRKRVIVRLYVETPVVRLDFDRWLADIRGRHPWKMQRAVAASQAQRSNRAQKVDAKKMSKVATETYFSREAVGVFSDPGTLEAAIDELEVAGFDRAAISVLATSAKAKEHIDRFYRNVKGIEDRPDVSRPTFVSNDSRTEGEAAVVGIPLYIGGFAGAAAVAAAGGALALAIAGTIVGVAAGASLGAVLAAAIEHHHSVQVEEQLAKGGLVLWVSVPKPEAEKRAFAILEKMGARDVHVHAVQRTWNLNNIPLAMAQPDPFLERDKY